ncbi:Conserved oligomeric Golgi complex subunit 2 [Trichinella pseudospiralis]|uniref:Conserved oligomeric Golgi complex subunit 2 n=1 Tax=Trichinella pseudospiralis TaxID=6337 RepID=A0A0V1JM23_TRIPS|nr:Conserved oligomeric Golgi complex subunit 2 [Trichinella pseudospiralis]KRY75277.1 Conserved oligomeric Golgi complex subunit 2 [Trichinella pseudospiralis]KRZ21386.1 Conserved oligomeric Golgi complex subunit 2 [Trichinella pseudospiralis]KRZ36048.1 Conserved oligomeric Golgi complex subunit 2 [Trichinella pseudospiralis]
MVEEEWKNLAFDCSAFTQDNFDVQELVRECLNRGYSLERIRGDLGIYLKSLQNNMVEMINEDYVEFVQLSSSLANVQSTVDALVHCAEQAASNFNLLTEDVVSMGAKLRDKLKQRCKVSEGVGRTMRRMRTMTCLEECKLLLRTIVEESRDEWKYFGIGKLIVYIFQARALIEQCDSEDDELKRSLEQALNSIEQCVQEKFESALLEAFDRKRCAQFKLLFDLFCAANGHQAMQRIFINELIVPNFSELLLQEWNKGNVSELLERVLDKFFELHHQYRQSFTEESENDRYANFFVDCLLTAVIEFLDKNIKSVYIPTDVEDFRRGFQVFTKFASNFVETEKPISRSTRDLLHGIYSKFDLRVYYQLCYQDIRSQLEAVMENGLHLKRSDQVTSGGEFKKNYTFLLHEVFENCIEQIWCNNFLLPLASCCLELTYDVLNSYGNFLLNYKKQCLENIDQLQFEQTDQSDHLESATDQLTKMKNQQKKYIVTSVVLFLNEACNFCERCSEVCKLRIGFQLDAFPQLRPLWEQGLVKTVDQLDEIVMVTCETVLSNWLLKRMDEKLSTVVDIPRLYRWTRKSVPETALSYVGDSFALVDRFCKIFPPKDAGKSMMLKTVQIALEQAIGNYLKQAKEVIDSVEKVSNSLIKLKRSGRSAAVADEPQMTTVSDDAKIKLQLRLDLEEAKRLLQALPVAAQFDTCMFEEILSAI